jgi:hypothetical protein
MAYAEHTKTSLKGLVALLQSGGSGKIFLTLDRIATPFLLESF